MAHLPRNNVSGHGSIHTEALIIGAGPAGLAVAACLRRAEVPFVLLERSDRVGSSWYNHYDRLHLHTDRARSSLPFFPMPRHYPRYPSRVQVIAYLEAYARRFGIAPEFGQQVIAARREGDGWLTLTQDRQYRSRSLVVATGYNRRPQIPTWPGQEFFQGTVIHSSGYRNGAPHRGARVLVVGCGNSGGEIAIDLHEHGALPALSIRGPLNVIPRDLLGVPILLIAEAEQLLPAPLADALNAQILRLVFGGLSQLGLTKAAHGPLTQVVRRARIPLIDVGTIGLIRAGQIEVFPGIERFSTNSVIFADQREQAFDAVILATGYHPAVSAFLDAPGALNEQGIPRRSGVETVPGLYFCGFYVTPIGMLKAISSEARQIARQIARRTLNR